MQKRVIRKNKGINVLFMIRIILFNKIDAFGATIKINSSA
jgi:hypothetical protein